MSDNYSSTPPTSKAESPADELARLTVEYSRLKRDLTGRVDEVKLLRQEYSQIANRMGQIKLELGVGKPAKRARQAAAEAAGVAK